MVVTQNEDGTLYITENGEQIKNPGNFIYGMGGIEAVLARCKEMSIGYQCNQYDCDGRQATTIKLDTPIQYNGEMVYQFQTGAPRGHLNKYHRI